MHAKLKSNRKKTKKWISEGLLQKVRFDTYVDHLFGTLTAAKIIMKTSLIELKTMQWKYTIQGKSLV